MSGVFRTTFRQRLRVYLKIIIVVMPFYALMALALLILKLLGE